MKSRKSNFPRSWLFLCGALLSLLSGCSWFLSQLTPAPQKIFTAFPNTASLGATLSCVQKVKVVSASENQDFLAQLEIDTHQLTLIALTPFQTRAFTLFYDNTDLTFTPGPGMKLDVDPNFFLTDLTLALWPAHEIHPLLSLGIAIEEQPLKRIISANGEVIFRIDYSSNTPWQGNLHLTNTQYGYSLEINTIACSEQ